jgi:hypothetical protein
MKKSQKDRLLEMIQDVHPNYHPILSLAEIATDNDNDVKVRLDASKVILPYIEAQLKSIEIKGDGKSDYGVLRVILGESNEIDEKLKNEDTSP